MLGGVFGIHNYLLRNLEPVLHWNLLRLVPKRCFSFLEVQSQSKRFYLQLLNANVFFKTNQHDVITLPRIQDDKWSTQTVQTFVSTALKQVFSSNVYCPWSVNIGFRLLNWRTNMFWRDIVDKMFTNLQWRHFTYFQMIFFDSIYWQLESFNFWILLLSWMSVIWR